MFSRYWLCLLVAYKTKNSRAFQTSQQVYQVKKVGFLFSGARAARKMIDFIKSFKSLIKLDQIHTDNNVFKLHYKFTVIMLVVFCLVLSSKLIFGEQIECLSDSSKVDKDFANSYCWMQATYVLNATSRSLSKCPISLRPKILKLVLQINCLRGSAMKWSTTSPSFGRTTTNGRAWYSAFNR